jgi:GWxTD domain-containing protein
MRFSKFFLVLALLSLGFSAAISLSSPADKPKKSTKKNEGDRARNFKKWLDEDVQYIISPDEKKVFKELKNDEEREHFIDDFWNRRNPNPRSGDNVFKEEHYRRIAYANEHYHSGIPGWKTDRGRIYIMFGKPDELESHPMGGPYFRTSSEGGGTTSTFPFEKWWYRHIEGIGDDIELEFVDHSASNEYRLAMLPDEKDALINVPNVGLTDAEAAGQSEKRDRAYFNPTAWNDPNNPQAMNMRAKDKPFARMEQFFSMQRQPQIKFDDLKTMVTTHVSYNNLSYAVRADFLKLSPDKVLVPVTLEIDNKILQFKKDLNVNKAVANIYGCITGLNNRIAKEFDDTITLEYSDEAFEQGKNARSEYQKIVWLPPGQRYKLDMVLEDVNSKKDGILSIGLNIPKYDDTTLQTSTIILANSISQASLTSDQLEQYVIGDLRIFPNVTSEYDSDQDLKSYLQIYNAAIDQTSLKPSLDVSYTIKKEGKIVAELQDNAGKSIQLISGLRVVLLKQIPLRGMNPGAYTLEIEVTDTIMNRSIKTSANFKIKGTAASASGNPNPK